MSSNEFWRMLSEPNKEKVEEMLHDYAGSDGIIGRIFELYTEGASLVDCTVEEYLEKIHPNEYVEYCYESYLYRQC